jgi:hypothetical protein
MCEEGCAACGWDPASGTCHFCKTLAKPGLVWRTDLQSCAARDRDGNIVAVPDPPKIYQPGEPMPLVFGLLADDDMCNMFGYFIHQSDLPKLQ